MDNGISLDLDSEFEVHVNYIDQGMGHGHHRVTAFQKGRELGHIPFHGLPQLQAISDSVRNVLEDLVPQAKDEEEGRFYHIKEDGVTTILDRQKMYPGIRWGSEKMAVSFIRKLNAQSKIDTLVDLLEDIVREKTLHGAIVDSMRDVRKLLEEHRPGKGYPSGL